MYFSDSKIRAPSKRTLKILSTALTEKGLYIIMCPQRMSGCVRKECLAVVQEMSHSVALHTLKVLRRVMHEPAAFTLI